MLPNYEDFLIKRFEQPDEVRTFEKGKFETVKIGSLTRLRQGYGVAGSEWQDHDSWVVGDEPYVSLHFLGAEHYAQR